MYAADISQASVMALFLLVDNMKKLMPKFLELRPGTRIVANTFGFGDAGWEPDDTETVSPCTSWCTVHLWIVPADVAGVWQLPEGTLTLSQKFQNLTGNACGHSHLQRQGPGPRDLLYRQRNTICREGGRKCDGGRQRHTAVARDPLFACRRNAATKMKDVNRATSPCRFSRETRGHTPTEEASLRQRYRRGIAIHGGNIRGGRHSTRSRHERCRVAGDIE